MTGEETQLGASLGHAIRKMVARLHCLAPSSAGQPAAVIEQRLKAEEGEILKQLRLLEEPGSRWQRSLVDS